MKRVIKCKWLFQAKDETVLENMSIFIENNLIVDVMKTSDAEFYGYEIVDLSDKFVMPGLIDAHVHVNFNGGPTEIEKMHYLTIGDLTLKSMVNAQADLMAGFTTIRDEGACGYSDVAVKNAINSGLIWGPRMFVSGIAIGATGGHADSHFNPYIAGGSSFGSIIDSPDEGRKAARTAFKYGADQLKLMATGGVLSYGDEPGAPELTFEEMKAAIDIAKERGKITSAHAHGAGGIKRAVKAGITSIEHGMMMDEECIDLMIEHGTYLIPTIIAAHNIVVKGEENGIPGWAVEKAEKCLSTFKENLKKAIEKGLKIGFGTDAATPFNRHGEQSREFELMAEYGFTPAGALLAATKVNSELLKWDDKIGTIESGKFADIIAFDENPLENISTMRNCSFVMKDGKIYK